MRMRSLGHARPTLGLLPPVPTRQRATRFRAGDRRTGAADEVWYDAMSEAFHRLKAERFRCVEHVQRFSAQLLSALEEYARCLACFGGFGGFGVRFSV